MAYTVEVAPPMLTESLGAATKPASQSHVRRHLRDLKFPASATS